MIKNIVNAIQDILLIVYIVINLVFGLVIAYLFVFK